MSGSVDLALSYQTMSQSKIVIHVPTNKREKRGRIQYQPRLELNRGRQVLA
jgi:hypothetical protein